MKTKDLPDRYMFWTDSVSMRYVENAALKPAKKWITVIAIFGSHRLIQELLRDLCDDT